MKRKTSYLLTISGLLFVIAGLTVAVRFINRTTLTVPEQTETKASGLSVLTVLEAHIGSDNTHWRSFTQKATQREGESVSTTVQNQVETKLSLSTDGTAVRYDRATLNLNLSFLLKGNSLVRTISYSGKQLEVKPLEGRDAARVTSQITTFGMLPLLKYVSDPATLVFYVGSTPNGDQFEVKAPNGSWYFYSNSKHLIDRLQFGQYIVTYDDYRQVGGLNLPFNEKVSKGDSILYEIQFDEIDLNPVFASGIFENKLS